MRTAPLIDSFGKQATYGLNQWTGKVGARWAGVTLLGKGEGGGVLKAYYASGREIPEFDSTGARNWKYHTSDDTVEVGPPDLIPGLPNFKTKGRSWVEWLLPAELSEGVDEPEQILWFIHGLKVHDYTFSGGLLVQGAKIVSANNALVALFIATQRMNLPLTRFHKWGQSWIDFKDRCAGTLAYDAGSGLLAQYYSDGSLTTLVHTRNEAYIDRDWDHVSPAPDVPAAPFSARFTGKVKPTHTGTWTFYARYDDACRLWVNGVQLVNDWAGGAMRETPGTISLTANTEYDIVVEYRQDATLGGLHLSWSHASVPKEIVPQSALIPPSRTVSRYSAHVAFPSGTPALVAFNSVFRRAPGCSWQDVNGAIRVLSTPDRAVTKKFTYDLTQTNIPTNITLDSFSLKPLPKEDRPDYLIFSYLDVEDAFFRERPAVADRRLDPDLPPKYPVGPVPLGVCDASLASRIAETEMNILRDLSFPVSFGGFADSHKVARCDVVELSHEVPGIRESAPLKLFITEEKFLSPDRTADERTFVGRLHDPNWYSDQGYVPMEARIASDIASPFVPPPVVTSVTLSKFDRFLPDDTHVPVVQGTVQFAAHPYPQRGRVYWKRPRKTVTADAVTNTLVSASHGLPDGTKVELFTTGGLPSPLAISTAYYVRNATRDTLQLSVTPAGSIIDLTTSGSGVNELREYDFAAQNILVTPDASLVGRFEVENVPLGVNDFKVVTESLKGVSSGAAAAATYTITVAPLPLPPDLTGAQISLKNKAFNVSWTPLDPALYPDLAAYVVYDETGAEIGRTRDSRYLDTNLPTGTPVNTYTVRRKVKALLRGGRLSANFAEASVNLKRPAAPTLTVTMAQPQEARLNIAKDAADVEEEILSTEIEISTGAGVQQTITLPGYVRHYDVAAQFSVYPQLKFKARFNHVAPIINPGLQNTSPRDIDFAPLNPADLGTGTPSAAKYVDGGTGAWTPLPTSGVGGTGTTGRVPKWSASSTLADSVLNEASSRVGIGLSGATPAQTFEVKGAGDTRIRITIASGNSGGLEAYTSGGTFKGGFLYYDPLNITSFYGPDSGGSAINIDSAGRVGMGTTFTPNSKAVLDLGSTTLGFLPPRMTTTQRDAITSPPEGLEIYNTTTKKKNFYDGTAWRVVTST